MPLWQVNAVGAPQSSPRWVTAANISTAAPTPIRWTASSAKSWALRCWTPPRPTRWSLPEGFVLQPGEYRVVYASGLNRKDAAYPHTSFGLSSEGEEVVLADNTGRIADRVEFGLMGRDSAWKKNADGTWSSGTPTPGAAN